MTGPSAPSRGEWQSRFGFILAAAGSAIGLGNIWRFPYVVGENGGAAFVVIYLAFVFLIAAPVMLAEFAVGRNTARNPVGAFAKLAPGSLWKLVGILGVVTGVAILSFYGVIAGWTVGYFFKMFDGSVTSGMSADASAALFTGLVGSWKFSGGLLFVFLVLTGLIVWRGVARGIELMSKILMPMLLLLLLILAIRAVTLPGAGSGLRFYLAPDFSAVTASTFPTALGQAFFSLSLGMGTMITYGSYIQKREHLATAAGWVCLSDTLIAFLAGLIIFPALFSAGLNPAGGPGLVFQVLPPLFATLPAGHLFGGLFFLLLAIAALTSTISLLEVPVAYLVDEWRWSRGKAVFITTAVTFLIGIPSALANGAVGFFSSVPGVGVDALSLMNIAFGNYSLSIGSLLLSLFVGYRWGVKAAVAEVEQSGVRFSLKSTWAFLIRFLCPVAVAVIVIYIVWTGNYF
jgi:neurotransmitter:Na+ symporter, NSS family